MDSSNIEIIVHTPTIEDYIKVVSTTIDHGITWCDGDTSIMVENWAFNKTKTCIIIEYDVGLWYCRTEWAATAYPGIKIISREEFLKYIYRDRFKNKYDLR